MKKIMHCVRNIGLLTLLLSFFLPTGSIAQNYIGSSNLDNIFEAAPGGQPTWMNNAEFRNSNGTLYGVVWDDGGSTLSVRLMFGTNFNTQVLAGPAGASAMRHPDIVLGGDNTTNYLCCVYTATVNNVDNVYAEFYTITFQSSPPYINFNPICVGAYIDQISSNATTGAGQIGDAHVDMLNEASAQTVLADYLVVTWEDILCSGNTTFGTAGAYAQFSVVAGCPGLPYFTLCPTQPNGCINPNTVDGIQPDVAAYGRIVAGPSFERRASFVYFDPNGNNNLYIREWNITTPGLSAATLLENAQIEYPRIDEIDNPLPAVSPPAHPEIVYRRYNTTTFSWDIRQRNNTNNQLANTYYAATTGTDNFSPVVTCGPLNQYAIAYANPGAPDILYHRVLWSNGLISQSGAPNYDIYEANYAPNGNVDAPVALANSWQYVGTPSPAIVPNEVFICWYNSSSDDIDYKITGSPVGFKPTTLPGFSTTTLNRDPTLFPVPAGDMVYLEMGAKGGISYEISDLTGRTIIKQLIKGEVAIVNTSILASGVYIASVHQKDNSTALIKFVKE